MRICFLKSLQYCTRTIAACVPGCVSVHRQRRTESVRVPYRHIHYHRPPRCRHFTTYAYHTRVRVPIKISESDTRTRTHQQNFRRTRTTHGIHTRALLVPSFTLAVLLVRVRPYSSINSGVREPHTALIRVQYSYHPLHSLYYSYEYDITLRFP